ncbi:TonB-dependent receptor [Bacteroides ovatus]|nr:TonB-dependent receptor [Bacteroides ovatus]
MYSYADRYLFQANVRHDGSSRFAKGYRWGTFPSFSAGWVASEEKFMKNLKWDWLSFLKLRGSWGMLGNERIGSNYFPYIALMSFGNSLSDYPFMHLLYSQLLVCQRVCLQNTVCLICK